MKWGKREQTTLSKVENPDSFGQPKSRAETIRLIEYAFHNEFDDFNVAADLVWRTSCINSYPYEGWRQRWTGIVFTFRLTYTWTKLISHMNFWIKRECGRSKVEVTWSLWPRYLSAYREYTPDALIPFSFRSRLVTHSPPDQARKEQPINPGTFP